MKRVVILTIAVLVLGASHAKAVRIYWRAEITGSGAGSLDAISEASATPGVPLAAGDSAVVIRTGYGAYFYTFDAASTAAESSPAVVAPDDAGVAGRWLRVPAFLLAADVSGLATVATTGSYNDLSDRPATHSHANLAAVNAITDAGSGQIITSTERTNFGTAYSHSQAAHAPASAEQNVNADWAASPGVDAYIQNKPSIPGATSQLTNDSGFLTSYSETDPGVNALGKATLACSTGQIAKYNGTIWTCQADIDTNTDTQWSGTSTGLTAATGRTSLGLGSAAVADTGIGATNVILGNDARLTDTRSPTAHNQAWSTITTTPTTLAGYGITDGGSGLTVNQAAAITGAALPSAANVFATIADVTAGGSYTDEAAQDAAGAMVAGNTETGIAVTYNDTANKLNFDASHNHTGTYAPTMGTDDNYVTDAEKTALHPVVTGTDGVSVTGQLIANTDKGSSAVSSHNSAYTHTNIHAPGSDNQTTVSGNAGGLAAQYIDWTASTGGASIANKPTIPTNTNQLTNGAGFLTAETDPGVNTLGKATLTCTTGQVAKYNGTIWACAADADTGTVTSVNTMTGAVSLDTDDISAGATNKYYTPTTPGDIGGTTPAAGTFTTLTATAFNLGQPPPGETGEISMPEDPANGSNVVGFKAPASIAADQLWLLPPSDGTNGQTLVTNGTGTLSWSTAGGTGDMLKATYDSNADNDIDDAAIASTIARDSEVPTNTNQLTNGAGFLTAETDPSAEPALGNPGTDGYVLSSTAAGVRSWIEAGGAVDLTAPGPIGSVTPNTGDFTALTASSFDWGTPGAGETGEVALLEAPGNGSNSVTIKAPATLAANVVWTLPASLGTNGSLVTNAPVTAPSTATTACTAGDWSHGSGFIYICIATNAWQRAALATW